MIQLKAKSFLEGILGNRIWIEKPAERDEVLQAIEAMRPTPAATPLIRIGGANDGGYLVPDDIDDLAWLVSPGVADNVGFDLEMAQQGMKVVMADASVDGPPVDHANFTFHKKFVGAFEDEQHLRLETLAADIDGDAMLQMDIEGDEYIVLLDASAETLNKFRVMVLECHNLTKIFSSRYNRIIRSAFRKLLQTHRIVHIHPNNVGHVQKRDGIEVPNVMEFTLVRKDRFEPSQAAPSYPHPLDEPCSAKYPELALPRIWWPNAA